MNNAMIQLNGGGYQIAATKEAEKLKLSLIKSASTVTVVRDKTGEASAISVASDLSSFRKQLETTRKAVKQPVLDLGKRIDSLAEKFGEDVEIEEKRIRQLLGGYQMVLAREQQKIQEEARRKQLEAEKILRDAEEAQHQKELAEQEAERLRNLKKSNVMAETRQERVVEKLDAKAEALEQAAIDARVEAMQLEQQADEIKVKGGRMEPDFEVLDIEQFYNEFPHLCTVSIKTRETKELLKLMVSKNQPLAVHGLRCFMKPVISIR